MERFQIILDNCGSDGMTVKVVLHTGSAYMASAIAKQGERAFRSTEIIEDEETGRVIYSRYIDDDFYSPELTCSEALGIINRMINER